MNRKRYKRSFKNTTNISFKVIFITIILFIIGSILIKLGIDFKGNVSPLYSYTVDKNDDYSILLKPNTFYDDEILPSNRLLCIKVYKYYVFPT